MRMEALACEVTFLYVVVALLISGAWSFRMRAMEQNQKNPYECGPSHSRVIVYAHYIHLVGLYESHVAS
jgi:NADH:ubiquinone oxidoreductase subunit 3 (subunit A)